MIPLCNCASGDLKTTSILEAGGYHPFCSWAHPLWRLYANQLYCINIQSCPSWRNIHYGKFIVTETLRKFRRSWGMVGNVRVALGCPRAAMEYWQQISNLHLPIRADPFLLCDLASFSCLKEPGEVWTRRSRSSQHYPSRKQPCSLPQWRSNRLNLFLGKPRSDSPSSSRAKRHGGQQQETHQQTARMMAKTMKDSKKGFSHQ